MAHIILQNLKKCNYFFNIDSVKWFGEDTKKEKSLLKCNYPKIHKGDFSYEYYTTKL